MKMKAKEVRAIGRENLKFQWGTSLLAVLIYGALITVANALPVVGAVIVAGPLLFGLTYVFYNASKKEKINLWDLFKGFEIKFGDSFLANLLVVLYTCLWSLLFVIPGIIKAYSYSMYMYLLIREPELSAQDSITKSREYMDGNKWRLFCLKLSFIGWDILEVITCGIVAIYVEPYKRHALMAFYNDIYESKNNPEYAAAAPTEAETVDPKFLVSEAEVVEAAEPVPAAETPTEE